MKFITTKQFNIVVILSIVLCVSSCLKKQQPGPVTTPAPNIIDGGNSFNNQPVVNPTISKGLLAFWPLEGNTYDLSGHENIGTGNSISKLQVSAHNDTYTVETTGFNGTNSYIAVNDTPSLRLANTDFTISLWLQSYGGDKFKNYDVLTKTPVGANTGWALSLGSVAGSTKPGEITFNVNGASVTTKAGFTVDSAAWCMVTITYRLSTQTLRIYYNGVLKKEVANIPSPSAENDARLYIGRNTLDVSANNRNCYKGNMNNIRIYNRVITAAEIQTLYTSWQAGVYQLQAYFPMLNKIKDLSLNKLDCKLYNVTPGTDRFGNPKGALRFNGNNSYAVIGCPPGFSNFGAYNSSNADGTCIFFNAWVKLQTFNPTGISTIMDQQVQGNSTARINFNITSASGNTRGKIGFIPDNIEGNVTAGTDVDKHITIGAGSWHMITIIYYQGLQILTFVDGVQATHANLSRSPSQYFIAPASNFVVGRNYFNNTEYFDGCISDIRIYNGSVNDFNQLLKALD